MISNILMNVLKILNGYLNQNYNNKNLMVIHNELNNIIGEVFKDYKLSNKCYTYEEVQDILSTLNEKESIRRNKGVYYTPIDVVKFILINSVKMLCNKLKPNNLTIHKCLTDLHTQSTFNDDKNQIKTEQEINPSSKFIASYDVSDLNSIPYDTFCYEQSIYDPCCGSGIFLLTALDLKFNLLDLHHINITQSKINKVVGTIKGNDLNQDSVIITKIRLFLYILNRCGVEKIKGISEILNKSFKCYDYVEKFNPENKYDIIIGNPPYVENVKNKRISSETNGVCEMPLKKYGNIYANVLENASKQLKQGGVLGFIIPLSYISTPRMNNIRHELCKNIKEQYILSYADRPDCLFTSVHQKLCIILGRNEKEKTNIYTSNYKYWYRDERKDLFNNIEVVKNDYIKDEYIPKLGTQIDIDVYKKIEKQESSIINLMKSGSNNLYLNMSATFWIKAFMNEHISSEYKVFKCETEDDLNYCICLLNSSLFWWYWICVSDCWHITRKELLGFKIPKINDFSEVKSLAKKLEEQLENTKLYVGTKQTEYEYKHKLCIKNIHQIDDYINKLFCLTDEESLYIKNFAYRYRIGGGIKDGCN